MIKEETNNEKHHVMFWGRANPPHAGHEKAVEKVAEVAKKHNATSSITLTRSHDPKKNPLTPEQKLKHAKRAFPHANVELADKEHPTILHHLSKVHSKGVTHLHIVAGSDRIPEYKRLIHQYNGQHGKHGHFDFKDIKFHSSGKRDPDSEGTEGHSASKYREAVSKNDKKTAHSMASSAMSEKEKDEMFNDVKVGMNKKPEKKKLKESGIPHFKAMFLVGGPGSGKDFLIHSVLDTQNIKEVSMERVFNAIIKETNIEELDSFPSIVINGNADNKDKIILTKAILEEMGYDTSMVFVYTSEETSKTRNDYRIARGSKTFSENVRAAKYKASVENMSDFVDMFESFVLFDNSSNFITVNEQKKEEITNWLIELSEFVTNFFSSFPKNESSLKWIAERVLEVGTNETNQFARTLTPGQISNEVKTYAEADKMVPKKKCRCEGTCGCEGGVTSANSKGYRDYQGESAKPKIISKSSNPSGKYKRTPPGQIGLTGTHTDYSSGNISLGGPDSLNEKSKKPIKKELKKFPSLADPGSMYRMNAQGGGGDYVPSVGAMEEAKKTRKKMGDYKNQPVSSDYGITANLGSAPADGGFPSMRESRIMKNLRKKILNGKKVSDGLGNENEMGSSMLTALTPATNESKSLDQIKSRISSTIHNFDEELGN
jgi:hypothetical protein